MVFSCWQLLKILACFSFPLAAEDETTPLSEKEVKADLRLCKRNHFSDHLENEIVVLIKIAFLQILVTY